MSTLKNSILATLVQKNFDRILPEVFKDDADARRIFQNLCVKATRTEISNIRKDCEELKDVLSEELIARFEDAAFLSEELMDAYENHLGNKILTEFKE